MKVRFYSYGGSGLKFITNFFKCNTNIDVFDKDHNPHVFLDINNTDIDKQVFIHSNPINAVISFCKRNKKSPNWIKNHLKHLN